ncbi:hypothetical protein AU468_12815 [Alkalispirochaeta sphaeroplastigenens]|uniref:Peptidase M23 domain-containing protein n=1 Tax=Alkalispirochaeta sphaeroplastigenens TaxID=1187066 RepID=A0A2S4JG52_9SPIO|nr:M23 family metallopeptidase [Alkalispirochaeta sphaeroplastigenens]POQ98469.1 hypothetical protein AU468_12815 [Alkalispirochaeta sphaeroplastigenens]
MHCCSPVQRGPAPALFVALIVLVTGTAALLPAQETILRLDRDDPIYLQHQEILAEYRDNRSRGEAPPPLQILRYLPSREDTLFSVASSLMLPYSSIATLNRLSRPVIAPGKPLYIPSRPGLFLPPHPETPLEEEMIRRLSEAPQSREMIVPDSGERSPLSRLLKFVPQEDFTRRERDLFLRPAFRNPLPEGVFSSPYGYRRHPMTGARSFHRGLDIAAPFGRPVRSSADGVVASVERDPLYGLSVRVHHGGDYTSVYAHLQEALVKPGASVAAGERLGTVGSTGFSTGPHLHFEILHRGTPLDPEPFIR